MARLSPNADSNSHLQRELVLRFYLIFPHMARLLNGVGVELVDEQQIPENEVINWDMQGAELGYTSCNTPRKLWDALSRTNNVGGGDVYGQIISIHSMTPDDVLTIACCFEDYFNIKDIFEEFLARDLPRFSIPYCDFSVHDSHIVWSWSLKLYCVKASTESLFPLIHGEDYGRFPASDSLVICRSNTIVALAFDRHNRSGRDDSGGRWRVLVLTNGRYFEKRAEFPLVSSGRLAGYEAFLKTFLDELIDTRREMRHLYDQIMDLTKPKDNIMFDESIRDDFFGNSSLDLSRNYFWALKTIEILNGSLETLLERWDAYKDIPVQLDTHSSDPENLIDSLPESLHETIHDIEREMQKFREMINLNDKRRQEIRMQLQEVFSASSAREARTAVIQGRYVRTLTSISTAFLPIMLVTSIFSMSVMPSSANLQTLAITLAAVCIPVYFCALVLTGDLPIAVIIRSSRAPLRYFEQTKVHVAEVPRWVAGVWHQLRTRRREHLPTTKDGTGYQVPS